MRDFSTKMVLLGTFFAAALFCVNARDISEESPAGKALGLFSVVTFANDVCAASGGRNGTCYTAAECEAKKGVSQGNCAGGYGVCCLFELACGATASQNNTYFKGSQTTAGSCSLKVCKFEDNICQLRLDFTTFVINGPATATDTKFLGTNGNQVAAGGKKFNTVSVCETDTFSVTGAGRNSDILCGTNSGEHMYIDASDACNTLLFQFAGTGTRNWDIKTTQYSCNSDNLAPAGCTNYIFGTAAESGSIMTFNYAGGQHLANQKQTICIRREKTNCRICYYAAAPTDFAVSGKSNSAMGKTKSCCGYGTMGTKTEFYDCVLIPGAAADATPFGALSPKFCGQNIGLVAAEGATSASVCTTQAPFRVQFLSDGMEGAETNGEGLKAQKGFKLAYKQDALGC